MRGQTSPPAEVLSRYLYMILAPVGLAKLKHREFALCVEIVTIVENGDLARFVIHRAYGSVLIFFDEVGLGGAWCLSVKGERLPELGWNAIKSFYEGELNVRGIGAVKRESK